MKTFLYVWIIVLIPFLVEGQTNDSTSSFGVSINLGFNGELNPIRLIPTITYTKYKNQLELGVGIHPFISYDQGVLSVDLNYKYYPNGMGNKFNMYFLTNLSYANNKRKTYYPTTYNYLFLNGGYGFDVIAAEGVGLYLGTNISLGAFTYSRTSEVPFSGFESHGLFKHIGYAIFVQCNIGYRF